MHGTVGTLLTGPTQYYTSNNNKSSYQTRPRAWHWTRILVSDTSLWSSVVVFFSLFFFFLMIIGELPLFPIFLSCYITAGFVSLIILHWQWRDIKMLAVKNNILEQVHWLGVSYLWWWHCYLVNIDPQQLKDRSHVHLVTLVIITAMLVDMWQW